MSKKTYDVSTPRTGSFSTKRNDSSFASCLCTMLVILAICSLLLLLSFSMKKMANKKEYKDGRGKYERIIHDNTSARNEAKEDVSQEIIETTQDFARTTQKIISVSTENTETLREFTGDSETEETMTVPSTIVTVEEKKDRRFDEALGSQETTSQITSTQSDITTNTPPEDETLSSKTTLDNREGGTETVDRDLSTTETPFTESTTSNSVEYETTSKAEGTIPTATPTYFTSGQSTETISTTLEAEEFTQKITELSVETETTPTTQFREETMPSTSTGTEGNKTIFTDSSTEHVVSTTQSTQEVYQTSTDFTSIKPTTINERDYVDEKNDYRNESSKEVNDDFNTLNFKDKDTCSSRKCNKMAARIISFMEPSEKPCNDFYNYACGGIHVDVEEQVDIFRSEMFGKETPKFVKDFFNFYRSCKDFEDRFLYKERIDALFKLLPREVAGYDDDSDIEQLLANLILMESFPYMEIGIDVNPENSSSFILALRKPKYKAPNSQSWSSFSERRRKCLRKTSEKLNASTSDGLKLYNEYWGCYLNHTDYLATIESLRVEQNGSLKKNKTLQEIKQSVGNISRWLRHLDDSLNSPNIHIQSLIKVEELQEKHPILNWKKFFSLISNGDIHGDNKVWIDNKAHFDLLMIRMKEVERRDLANVLRSIGEYSIFENIVLQSHVDSRTEFCKGQAKYLMPDVVNYLYKIIPNSELPGSSGYIRNIFDHFKMEFNSSLESSTWIDEDSRATLIEKLEGIRLSLFKTEDYAEERDFLNRIYNGSVMENDYPTNLINLIKHKNGQILSLQGQEVTSAKIHRYLISATDDLPLYIQNNGVAYIPYGLIEKASKELPDYLVMAQVGFSLAKIIGQTFSPNNIRNILINQETHRQYSHFLDTMTSDGTFSKPFIFNNHSLFLKASIHLYLDELVVENTALRLLTDRKETFGIQSLLPWISYQFSREKIFFLGLTQELCRKKEVMDVVIETYQNYVLPSPLRILNILSHSEEFSKHFTCDSQSSVFRSYKLQFPYIQMYVDESLLN